MTAASPLDLPAGCALIEVHVADLKQLFNSLDPTPFRERDLDPRAEEFIAGWARETARRGAARPAWFTSIKPASAEQVDSVYMRRCATISESALWQTRRQLRQLFQVGRTSLLIGAGLPRRHQSSRGDLVAAC